MYSICTSKELRMHKFFCFRCSLLPTFVASVVCRIWLMLLPKLVASVVCRFRRLSHLAFVAPKVGCFRRSSLHTFVSTKVCLLRCWSLPMFAALDNCRFIRFSKPTIVASNCLNTYLASGFRRLRRTVCRCLDTMFIVLRILSGGVVV